MDSWAITLFGFLIIWTGLVIMMARRREGFERGNYFPWNEVNVVRKRVPGSTVVECSWSYVRDARHGFATPSFAESDPVIFPWSNVSP